MDTDLKLSLADVKLLVDILDAFGLTGDANFEEQLLYDKLQAHKDAYTPID